MKKKILIMDDEEGLCKGVASYLTELGYDAYYAFDGQEGLKLIQSKLPDLLLLDIRMPKMDGIQVLSELTARFPNLIIVVVSGYLDAEITAKAIEFGAAMCVDKPFKMETLSERVIQPLIGPPK